MDSDAYLWRRTSCFKKPWFRKYLNQDFLKVEQKRIKENFEWYTQFKKAKAGEGLDEATFYLKPIELDSEWKASIAKKGNYKYVVISTLKNCAVVDFLMLIPEDITLPEDGSLIKILKSKKDYLHNEKTNDVTYVVELEKFEPLEQEYIYVDVPFEEKNIFKFLKENLVRDDTIASSFQTVLSSAPYVINDKGGITLSAFQERSGFSEEFYETLRMMHPPEFVDLEYSKSLTKGTKFELLKGIKTIFAEKNILGTNYFRGFSAGNYKSLELELMRRLKHRGEYSISCSLIPHGKGTELLYDILSKFVKTEITLPFTMDELEYERDINLLKTQKAIDEDLHIQIAKQRQLIPTTDSMVNTSKLQNSLIIAWQVILEGLGQKKNIEHICKAQAYASLKNILRIAQSKARDTNKKHISEGMISQAFKLFNEQAEKLCNNSLIQNNIKSIIPQYYENKKYNAVRAELSLNELSPKELFENVKQYFKDIYELQEYIDRLEREGWVYSGDRLRYKWV